MTRYVALLRGVNVGTARRLPMATLRDLLRELGHTGVSTLLNSGNAVFTGSRGTAAKQASAIAAAIVRRVGFAVPVIVLSARDLAAIVAANPIVVDPSEHPRMLVVFPPDAAALAPLADIATLVDPPEQYVVGRAAAYLHCANGILESRAAAALVGKAGRAVTTRNWATTLKLLAQVGATVD